MSIVWITFAIGFVVGISIAYLIAYLYYETQLKKHRQAGTYMLNRLNDPIATQKVKEILKWDC